KSVGICPALHACAADDRPSFGVPLVAGIDGALYGVSQGTPSLPATIFRVDGEGSFTILHSFSGLGERVNAALVLGRDGAFFGTASCSCPATIFRIDTAGTFTPLHSFRRREKPH